MSMHRKKVRLRCHLIYTLWCLSSCDQLFYTFIGLITPWDPGILQLHLPTVIYLYIKCQCIGRKLDLKVNVYVLCGVLHMLSNTIQFEHTLISM